MPAEAAELGSHKYGGGTFSMANQMKKKAVIQHYLKIVALFVIWCIYTVCMMTQNEFRANYQILSVLENGQTLFRLKEYQADKAIELYAFGPFQPNQDYSIKPSATEPQLRISVQTETTNTTYTDVSNEIDLIILNPQHLEYMKLSEHRVKLTMTERFQMIKEVDDSMRLYLLLRTNIKKSLSLKLSVNMTPVDEFFGITLGGIILLFLYIMIILECVNRTFASLIAAILGIALLSALGNRPPIYTIIRWIDVETLMLLFGMMVLVAILSESGVFDYLAVFAYELAKGNLWALLYILCFFTAILSAFLDNVTMMLLVTPVTIRLCEVTNLDPVPVLMSMVIFSNIGAALTPVGDPPNIIIMTNEFITADNQVNFGSFIAHMAPGVALSLLSVFMQIRFITHRKITSFMNKESAEIELLKHQIKAWERAAMAMTATTTEEELIKNTLLKKANALRDKMLEVQAKNSKPESSYQESLAEMKANYPIRNKPLLYKSSVAFIFVLVLFCMHSLPHILHLSLGWTALLGAILLLILADEQDLDVVLRKVEWATLLFFASLFIMMEALTHLGLIGEIGELVSELILFVPHNYRLLVSILLILWVTGIASAFLDNIPVTTMMLRIVINLAQNKELSLSMTPLVWALAFGACLGGNGTLIGASANVVASGVADQHGYRFSFVKFFLFGFPITLNTLVVTSFYLLLAHCAFTWH